MLSIVPHRHGLMPVYRGGTKHKHASFLYQSTKKTTTMCINAHQEMQYGLG